MKIGLIPAKCVNSDIDYNANQIISFIKDAAEKNVDYIFFGESYLQGFYSLQWDYSYDKTVAISQSDEIMLNITSIVKKFSVGVGFGYFESNEDKIYSSYIVISKDGNIIANYREMIQEWKEFSITDDHYIEGNQICNFQIQGQLFTIALCGDLWDEKTQNMFNCKEIKQSIILWPIHVDFSLEAWSKELEVYHKQALMFSRQVFMINHLMNPSTYGGAFEFQKDYLNRVPFEKEEMLIIGI